MRLWLFGLVSLLEMQMLRVVRERYPNDAWTGLLTEERVTGARRVFDERRRRNEENDLSDCLQLGDKATVLMKDPDLFSLSGFASKRALETFFKEVGTLRNAVAHANDILSGRWPALVDLVTDLGVVARTVGGISFEACSVIASIGDLVPLSLQRLSWQSRHLRVAYRQ